ncbi:FAD:protein FMN transferase [Thermogemmatispora sp.]|uniref:FAD:protein FMN transferase n=1 Tax=Thermogemmatispora sp. TaxID=1968838 RepID=UPI001DC3F62A|nr:FAD:protein FMN transferase [Thermogemmatispora sp.]MBX5449802.1 FAD:protein FMN transferase [Thermogemmatispora sp.]
MAASQLSEDRATAAAASPEYITPPGLVRGSFQAMGTTVSYLLPAEHGERGGELITDLFSRWEAVLSRFLPQSELARLNRSAGQWVEVSELLYVVLTHALEAAAASDGLYDPTLLPQLQQLGYDRSFELLEQAGEAARPGESSRAGQAQACESEQRAGGAWRHIEVDPVLRRVRLPIGVQLDFGGIAKGMAVDTALGALRRRGMMPALVNAGGDLAVAGLPPDSEHWAIAVPGHQGGWTIPLRRGAMATSGIARRRWWQAGALRHHLLDPRTGLPVANGLWSVTVVADRCEQAEVAAKVAFILGPDQGPAFLRRHGLAGLLVYEDGRWESVAPWPIHLMTAWREERTQQPLPEEG